MDGMPDGRRGGVYERRRASGLNSGKLKPTFSGKNVADSPSTGIKLGIANEQDVDCRIAADPLPAFSLVSCLARPHTVA